jgi:branched-chain amino acid transport system ATP-binding protein
MSHKQALPSEKEPILSFRGVEAAYGSVQVLWGVDLSVLPGERMVLLGANGSGKSTLLKVLIGLLPLKAGSIWFEGQSIEKLPSHQRVHRGIMLMTEVGVFPHLSIESNLWLGGYRLPRRKMKEALDLVYGTYPWLAARRHKPAGSLSGGQRKLLATAKALLGEPKLLAMDEPSAGLAPVAVKEIIQILSGVRIGQAALLLAEHNVGFLELADRVAVLEGGTIRFNGTVDELNQNDRLRDAFFGIASSPG